MKNTKRQYTINDDGTIQLASGPRMKQSTYKLIRQYQSEYVRDKYRQFNIKIQRTRYQDVIDFMETQDNLCEYIVQLIRKDMLRQYSENPELKNIKIKISAI